MAHTGFFIWILHDEHDKYNLIFPKEIKGFNIIEVFFVSGIRKPYEHLKRIMVKRDRKNHCRIESRRRSACSGDGRNKS
jgi:hypothetical protein